MTDKKKNPVSLAALYVVLILITVITLLPLVWMLSASFKLSTEVFTVPIRWIPETFHWENYLTIWQKIPFALFTFNSFKLTIIVTLIQLLTCSFAAYGFTKCNFRGRDTLFLCYVATIAIPWQIYMLPQYSIMQKLGLVDTHLGYILMQAFAAFGVFCCASSTRASPTNCWKPPASTACQSMAATSASCCRWPSRPWRRWPSLPSSRSGTTSWAP